jgi:hypothetical protein
VDKCNKNSIIVSPSILSANFANLGDQASLPPRSYPPSCVAKAAEAARPRKSSAGARRVSKRLLVLLARAHVSRAVLLRRSRLSTRRAQSGSILT